MKKAKSLKELEILAGIRQPTVQINEATDIALFKGMTPEGKTANIQITKYASKSGTGIQVTTGMNNWIKLHPSSMTKLAKEWLKLAPKLNESLNEAGPKLGTGKITVDVDWVGPNNFDKRAIERKARIKIKQTGNTTADISGNKKDVYKYLTNPETYDMHPDDVAEFWPELFENLNEAKKPPYEFDSSSDAEAFMGDLDKMLFAPAMTKWADETDDNFDTRGKAFKQLFKVRKEWKAYQKLIENME